MFAPDVHLATVAPPTFPQAHILFCASLYSGAERRARHPSSTPRASSGDSDDRQLSIAMSDSPDSASAASPATAAVINAALFAQLAPDAAAAPTGCKYTPTLLAAQPWCSA